MGLDEKELKDLEIAALLHDVGKIGTFESIIDKKEKLTDEEYAVIKQHTIKESRGTIPGTGTDCGFCPIYREKQIHRRGRRGRGEKRLVRKNYRSNRQ